MTSFSIITITYNHKHGLEKTAHSVTGQTCTDYEWLIIDGASTDGTKDCFKNYPTAKITSEPDNGIYDAMNKGIEKATGDFLIFMNAGDQFATPEILDIIKKTIDTKRPDLVYGNSWEETETRSRFYKSAKPHTKINTGLFTHHQSIFYNRHSLGALRYDTSYKIAADYDLTLRFLKTGQRQCLYIDIPVCIFESGGVSQKNITQGRQEQFISRKDNGMPFIKNLTITTKQKIASIIRRLCPLLYQRLKS